MKLETLTVENDFAALLREFKKGRRFIDGCCKDSRETAGVQKLPVNSSSRAVSSSRKPRGA